MAGNKPKQFILRTYSSTRINAPFLSYVITCDPRDAIELKRLFSTRLSAPFLLVAADESKNYPPATKRRAEVPASEDDETTVDEKDPADDKNVCQECGGQGVVDGEVCPGCNGTGQPKESPDNDDDVGDEGDNPGRDPDDDD